MAKFLKKNSGLIYIVLATLLVLVILLRSEDLPLVLAAFKQLDYRWVGGAIGLTALYLVARAATLNYALYSQGARLGPLNTMLVTGIGQFYSAITPSSSGGQPMQLLALHQMGVPLSTGTAALSIKFIGFQAALLLLGAGMWLAHTSVVNAQLYGFRWLVAMGYGVNVGLVAMIVLTMFRMKWIDRFVRWCVHTLHRLHLVKDESASVSKTFSVLADYQCALKRLVARPLDAIVVFLLSCAQMLTLMSVVVCLYYAFGLSGYSAGELITLQLLLFITAAFVPLPGAAGAQEGGFCLFFKNVFPSGEILAAMLCWRFFTYYFLMLFGLLTLIVQALQGVLRRRKEQHANK
ncbi:MAG: lysylphosphatidylglycerol synthase transmembrane domain-containing protein [Clostridia bacterium]